MMQPGLRLSGLALALLLCLPPGPFRIVSRADRIVVYRAEDPEPWYVSGRVVPLLPGADRARLARGFTVPDEAAVRQVLEDYTG